MVAVAPQGLLLPFDAHNHIQLGPPPPLTPPLTPATTTLSTRDAAFSVAETDSLVDGNGTSHSDLVRSLGEYIQHELQGTSLSGMALMATHPRDFGILLDLERQVQTNSQTQPQTHTPMKVLPCLGVHPWFLHELDADRDWALVPSIVTTTCTPTEAGVPATVPRWIQTLESLLVEHPHVPVGEIGLDNFHFDASTQELTTPMDRQVQALRWQLTVATQLQRPVSLHCVRAMGKLLEVLDGVAEEEYQRLSHTLNTTSNTIINPNTNVEHRILPPRLYFHAFGGKAATATQLIKTLEKPRRIKIRNNNSNSNSKKKKFVSVAPPKVYFGFAPPVNFQSPKTASVIRAVGLDRLVLETDREDIRTVGPDMRAGVQWISEVLGIPESELVQATNDNVRDLYYSKT